MPPVACLLTAVVVAVPAGPAPEPRAIAADLDGDGVVERIAPYAQGDRAGLAVDGPAGRWLGPGYRLWGLDAGDLDGDGRAEVVAGVWSSRRRHAEPEPHRTVWVLAWRDGRLVERWRGSALARPLRDARVRDLDGDGRFELLALETVEARCVLTVYRWTGFGFVGLGRATVDCRTRLDDPRGRVERHGRSMAATLRDGRLHIEEVAP